MRNTTRYFTFLFALIVSPLGILGQPLPFQEGLFHAPMDIDMYLSGNFGELRSNHFHTGIDIKTVGREGVEIKAVQEGKLARVKVSPWGYGKALYFEHPSGYTTVYAHLQEFGPVIEDYVRRYQYGKRTFSVDFSPDTTIRVEAGDLIAYSGNSGSSGGPHLHFEIRNTETQKALNPLKFGFDIKDNIPPTIRGIRFYPVDEDSRVDGAHEPKSYVVSGSGGNYRLKHNPEIRLHGRIGVALHAIDKLNGYPNVCGIYKLKLEMDGREVMTNTIDSLSFYTNRYINAHKDYALFHRNYWHYHRSYKMPNNKLNIYDAGPLGQNGILTFKDSASHTLNYTAWDAYGNSSHLSLKVKSVAPTSRPQELRRKMVEKLEWDKDNTLKQGQIRVFIPNGALYDDMGFSLDSLGICKGCVSSAYLVGDPDIPLQESMTLRFKLLPQAWQYGEKLAAARITSRSRVRYEGGNLDGEHFEVRTRNFGKFALMVDSIAPRITPLTSNTTNQGVFRIKVRDDFSGIDRYDAWLGDKWLLLRYDPKRSIMWANLGEVSLPPGKHQLRVELVDNCGNSADFERQITVKDQP